MYRGYYALFSIHYNFFLLLGLYVLFCFLILVQSATAQTAMPIPQSTNVISKHSTQIPQYDEGNKMALLVTSGNQLSGSSSEDLNLNWKYVTIGSNSINNNSMDFIKSPAGLLYRNSSSNCTTLTDNVPSYEVPLRTNVTIGEKNYIIAYNITGNDNKLNSTCSSNRDINSFAKHNLY